MIKCSQEKKEQAVIDLCSRSGSVAEVARCHGASQVALYQWKNQLLNKEPCVAMPEKTIIPKLTIAEGTYPKAATATRQTVFGVRISTLPYAQKYTLSSAWQTVAMATAAFMQD